MVNKIKKICSNKYLQLFLIWFYLVSFGSFIGYGDVIQRIDFWMGFVIKGVGHIGIWIFMFFYAKNFKPKLFIEPKKIKCGGCKDSGDYCSYCERGGQRPYA